MKGDTDTDDPLLVRVHRLNLLSDVLGDQSGGRDGELRDAMAAIEDAGRGIVVLIGESRHGAVGAQLSGGAGGEGGALREVGIGSQILLDLGVQSMTLLSNSEHAYVGLDGFGLRVVGRQSISRTA